MWINLRFVLLNRWLSLKNGHLVKDWFLLECDNEAKRMIIKERENTFKKCRAIWIKNNHRHLEEF